MIAIFKHIFELLWGLPNCTHILVCHSVTSWWNPDYHTPNKRRYSELSYDPNSLNMPGVISHFFLTCNCLYNICLVTVHRWRSLSSSGFSPICDLRKSSCECDRPMTDVFSKKLARNLYWKQLHFISQIQLDHPKWTRYDSSVNVRT